MSRARKIAELARRPAEPILETLGRSTAESEWDSVEIRTELGESAARRLAAFELGVVEPYIHFIHEDAAATKKRPIRRYVFTARL